MDKYVIDIFSGPSPMFILVRQSDNRLVATSPSKEAILAAARLLSGLAVDVVSNKFTPGRCIQ